MRHPARGRRASPRRSRSAARIAVGVVLLVVATTTSLLLAVHSSEGVSDSPRTTYAYVTYYGWFDNTPPGCATSYAGCAGGTGTFAHPIMFASDQRELAVGTIVYYPTVQKYFVMGDDCQECDLDWSGHGPDGGPRFAHVDLWSGGRGGSEFAAINCENALTQSSAGGGPLRTPLIVNAPSGLPVSTEPIFDATTGRCYGGATTSTSYGRLRNVGSGHCLTDPGASSTSSTPVTLSKCTTAKDENFAYEADFLMVDGRCLEVAGTTAGSKVVLDTCNGNAREQWSVNSNGSITWIQYTYCLAQARGAVTMAKCSSARAAHWKDESETKP